MPHQRNKHQNTLWGEVMRDEIEERDDEQIPWGQKLFDRPFVWLIAGMVTMALFYTLWGIYEIYSLPQAALP